MPDANGLPTLPEISSKIRLVVNEELSPELQAEQAFLLGSVLAEFEAPVTSEDSSGTGREWHPTTETRTFDGTGYGELRVDDLYAPSQDDDGNPLHPVVVRCYDATLSDVGVKQARVGFGHNTLFYRSGGNGLYGLEPTWRFPRGTQNISVTATWGNPVPRDVWEALRSEVCYRLLVGGFIDLNGVGEDLKIGDYELNTSVGAINFKLTSPVTVFHTNFLNAITRHKERSDRAWRAYGASRRMS